MTTEPADLMSETEVIAYLRLAQQPGDARERLRNQIRRNRLPVVRCGRLKLFRRSSIDAWLEAHERGYKSMRPARLPAAKGLTARSSERAQPARNGTA